MRHPFFLFATPATLIAASLLLGAAPAALSQSTAGADPLDPKTSVPALVYRSAFQGYRLNADVELGQWREANDRVGRIGGWRAYAREAAAPDKPASAPRVAKP